MREFTDKIEFPNGEGYTPCTREYADLTDRLDAIKPADVNMNDLSPADYQEWNTLEDRRANLQLNGHLGKSVRYDRGGFDDLDVDPNTSRNEEIQKSAHIVNGGESLKSYPYPKCNGRGSRTYGYVNIKTYPCGYCRQTGKVTAQRETNIKRSKQSETTRLQNLNNKIHAWHNANPTESAYLMHRATKSGFYSSLLLKLNTYGSLTENQVEAIRKNMREDEARKAAIQAEAPTVDISAIEKLFATARENGLKKLAFHTEHLTVKASREDLGKAPALYVIHGGDYVGKIVSGKFIGNRDVRPDTVEHLNAVAADPLGAAVFYGRKVGRCSCCGRELTDPASVAAGIGPICASNWGM